LLVQEQVYTFKFFKISI